MPELIKKHLRILDIDLDFFLNKRHTALNTGSDRLNAEEYIPWDPDDVRQYLENKCGLNQSEPVRGKQFVRHDEVFFYLKSLQLYVNQQLTFEIDHLDAHADLGMGDCSYQYIAADILARPLKERCFPDKIKGHYGLSEGNYLSFLIACRWITSLRYINKKEWSEDVPRFGFKNFDISTGIIELKQFAQDEMDMIGFRSFWNYAESLVPISSEPPVKFTYIESDLFSNYEPYDLVFLTQSPYYTPVTADALIPMIADYIKLLQ